MEAYLTVGMAALSGCGTNSLFRTERLDGLQVAAGLDTGTVHVIVSFEQSTYDTRACTSYEPCDPASGLTVEFGIWNSLGVLLRHSSLSSDPDSARADPRFEVLAGNVSDAVGRASFAGVPRHEQFAVRAFGPSESGEVVKYFPSHFWLYSSTEMTLPIVFSISSGSNRWPMGMDSSLLETVFDGEVYGFGSDGREGIEGVTVEVAEWVEARRPLGAAGPVYQRRGEYRVIVELGTDANGHWSVTLGVPGEYGFRFTPTTGSQYQCTPWRHMSVRPGSPRLWFPVNLCNVRLHPERCASTFVNVEPRGC